MQRAVALEALLAEHPEWDGLVTGFMINQAQMGSVLTKPDSGCPSSVTIPIVQDDDDGNMWTAMGGKYNGIMIFDQDGFLVHEIYPAVFPDAAQTIYDVVAPILGE